MKLKLSADLELPLRAVTEKIAWIGTTGAGKTYAATKFAELLWEAQAQFVTLDPVGIWYGLRLQADGKKPSALTIPIFGGLHGDVPLEVAGGKLLADLIVDKGISAIVDVSQFEHDTDKTRFATDFCDRLFWRKKASPSALHLFLEECQEFVPQHPQRGEERMLHAFTRIQKIGRNYGIGSSYITQRPQDVSKKALNLAQTVFAFRTTGVHERKAIAGWMQEKGLDQDLVGELPKLATGTCHVWSPEFLQLSRVVSIARKHSFNASATPEVGATMATRHLAPIDLAQIRTAMAATIEKANAADPIALRRRILELEKELTVAKKLNETKPAPKVEVKTKEVPVLKEAQIKRIEAALDRLVLAGQQLTNLGNNLKDQLLKWRAVSSSSSSSQPRAIPAQSRQSYTSIEKPKAPPKPKSADVVKTDSSGIESGGLRILQTANMLAYRGLPVTRESVARWLGLHPNGGRFNRNLAQLRASGLLDGLIVTEAGIPLIEPFETGLEAAVAALSDESQRRVFREILAVHPNTLTREELASRLGLHPNGGRYNRTLAWLRDMGLIPDRGTIVATEGVFR